MHVASVLVELPKIIEQMISRGIRQRVTREVVISITPYDPATVEFPRPVPMYSVEAWQWMMNFSGWRDWHYVLPGGEFLSANRSNLIATAVRRPVLICLRYTPKVSSTQNVRQTIKDACRRQLKKYNPGIVRVLVNTHLYGIGSQSDPDVVVADLEKLGQDLLREYSRLIAVRFDIVTPPDPGHLNASHRTLAVSTDRDPKFTESITNAPAILLL